MPKPKDVTELRDQLLDAFEELKKDPRKLNQARELANIAGKVISSLKLELEYSFLKGEQPAIQFMGETSGKALRPGAKMLGN